MYCQRLRGSLIFDTVVSEFAHPEYSLAPLVSALDDRLPPTVCSSTFAAKRADMIETVRRLVVCCRLNCGLSWWGEAAFSMYDLFGSCS